MKRSGHLPMASLAYQNPVFTESLPARPLRILAEYIDPLNRLRRAKVGDTIVMFGSARIKSRDQALADLRRIKRESRGRRTREWHGKIRTAQSHLGMSRYYEDARELSRRITAWAMTLGVHPRRFVICSGGGPGIMEAANRGASEAKGLNVGLTISIPVEEFDNPYVTRELGFHFHYFFMRKFWFAYLAKAVIVFPGGFGTLDELFEVMTLRQTRKMRKHLAIVLFGTQYWEEVVNFEALIQHGMIDRADLQLFHRTDSVDEAFEIVTRHLAEFALAERGAIL